MNSVCSEMAFHLLRVMHSGKYCIHFYWLNLRGYELLIRGGFALLRRGLAESNRNSTKALQYIRLLLALNL